MNGSRVVDALTSAALRVSTAASGIPSAACMASAMGPPEVKTTIVSCCAAPVVSPRSAAAQRSLNCGQLSRYSPSCAPPIQRAMPASSSRWNAFAGSGAKSLPGVSTRIAAAL